MCKNIFSQDNIAQDYIDKGKNRPPLYKLVHCLEMSLLLQQILDFMEYLLMNADLCVTAIYLQHHAEK